jgi:hypothetical protein
MDKKYQSGTAGAPATLGMPATVGMPATLGMPATVGMPAREGTPAIAGTKEQKPRSGGGLRQINTYRKVPLFLGKIF